MAFRRNLLFLTSVVWCAAAIAQGRTEALQRETRSMSVMLRSQPPERTLHRADSLAALPALSADPYWRMEMVHYRGHALRLLGRLDEAMEAQIRAYELADSLDDHEGRINGLLSLASIHMDLDDVDRAGAKLREVFRLNQERPSARMYRVPLVLAAWSDYQGRGDSAIHWCNVALPMAEAAQDSFVMADIHFNLGISHGGLGHHRESEEAFKRALAVVPVQGYPHLEARVNDALAYMYLEDGRLDEVPALLDRAEELAVTHGAGEVLVNVLGDRIEYHLARGDSSKALVNIYRMLEVKDSISGTLRARALAVSQARFGVSRLEKELAITRAEAEADLLRAQRSRLAWGALLVIVVLAVVLIRSFHRQARLKQQVALKLERDKEKLEEENELLHQENLMARFETLKSQIDPHFLFNAMNTLYTLVETAPTKAREFISSFSALYRKVLVSRERTIVPVQEELELVRHYLFLQRMRFGDALRVDVDVPARVLRAYLPPFTLQMLLENAIKHNVISASRPLHITLGVEQERLVVRNDLRPRGTSEAGTGTGLENIRRRYAMLGAPEPVFKVEADRYEANVPLLNVEP